MPERRVLRFFEMAFYPVVRRHGAVSFFALPPAEPPPAFHALSRLRQRTRRSAAEAGREKEKR